MFEKKGTAGEDGGAGGYGGPGGKGGECEIKECEEKGRREIGKNE